MSRRHQRGLQPNPSAHGKGKVTVSLYYELVGTKSEGGAYPQSPLCSGEEMAGDDGKPKLAIVAHY
jgi:hypothetical protein